jgi:cytochrome c peroxidase
MKLYSIIFLIILASCSVDSEVKPKLPSNDIKEIVPDGWPQPVYRFENNPLTQEGFELGRELFYEELLSSNNMISCGSCHQLFSAFANADHRFSHGINDSLGNRNAPGLFNMNWNTSFMWDGGVNHLETQPLAPIANPIEMNENLNNVVAKLSSSNKYKQLFKSAFGNEEINSQKILKAFAQFQGVLYSYNSKYDQFKRNEVSLTNEEQAGYNLFIQKCNNCHREPLFTDHDFKNNGLPVDVTINDFGREKITGNAEDKFKFKTPTLRNITLTAPYMHDGRFNSLEQVLNHYANGISNTTNLDPTLQSGIPLTNIEKNYLKAFLFTLTDYKFVQDERFKDPN